MSKILLKMRSDQVAAETAKQKAEAAARAVTKAQAAARPGLSAVSTSWSDTITAEDLDFGESLEAGI